MLLLDQGLVRYLSRGMNTWYLESGIAWVRISLLLLLLRLSIIHELVELFI